MAALSAACGSLILPIDGNKIKSGKETPTNKSKTLEDNQLHLNVGEPAYQTTIAEYSSNQE